MPILVPEYAVLDVLRGLYTRLKDTTLWDEPNVLRGPGEQELDDLKARFKRNPPNMGFVYPDSQSKLPMVTILPGDWTTEAALLGEVHEDVSRETATVTDEVLVESAVGGESTFKLDFVAIVPYSLSLSIGGVLVPFSTVVDDCSGTVTLGTHVLEPGEKLTASYRYFCDQLGMVHGGEISSQRTHILVECSHPEEAMVLGALVWREMQMQRDYLERTSGMKNLAVSVQPFGQWSEILPAQGYRREVVLSYMASNGWSASIKEPTKLSVEIKSGD